MRIANKKSQIKYRADVVNELLCLAISTPSVVKGNNG